ncbi:MAG: hypothetical protein AB1782_11990 [Cyanobacteriota bacterium]
MNDQLKERILQEANEIDGKMKLTCTQAFKISEDFNLKRKDIGDACNELKIKIYSCQLGCF